MPLRLASTDLDRPDGSLTARHLRHGAEIRLPASYVQRDVELAYAVTAHRAQGMTVDTAHTLIADDTTRESLDVTATRGRQSTRLYEVTDATLHADLDPPAKEPRTPYEVPRAVLDRSSAALSATETIRAAHGRDQRQISAKTIHRRLPPGCRPPGTRCLIRPGL